MGPLEPSYNRLSLAETTLSFLLFLHSLLLVQLQCLTCLRETRTVVTPFERIILPQPHLHHFSTRSARFCHYPFTLSFTDTMSSPTDNANVVRDELSRDPKQASPVHESSKPFPEPVEEASVRQMSASTTCYSSDASPVSYIGRFGA